MAYTRVNWENLPSTKTPVNADNLNKMDEVINSKQDKLIAGTNITISDNTISVNDTYSTNEVKIGTFDGKALYRRFYIGTPTLNDRHWIFIDTSTWGIGSILNLHGMARTQMDYGGTFDQIIPRVVPDNIAGYGIGFGEIESNRVGIIFGTGFVSIEKLILVIEYTKETIL